MAEVQTQPEVLTLQEAAAFLRTSERTMFRLLASGRLPARKIGKGWRFCRSDLVSYVRGGEAAHGRQARAR